MKVLHLFSCLALLSLIACANSSKKKPKLDREASVSEISSNSPDSDLALETAFFDPKLPFTISEISTPHDYPSSLDDPSICEGWELDEKVISQILKSSRVMEGSEWHHIFDHLPCNHQAVIGQGNQEYKLSLNGGSWMSISNSDSSMLMGVFDKKFDQYFLSEPMREEDQ